MDHDQSFWLRRRARPQRSMEDILREGAKEAARADAARQKQLQQQRQDVVAAVTKAALQQLVPSNATSPELRFASPPLLTRWCPMPQHQAQGVQRGDAPLRRWKIPLLSSGVAELLFYFFVTHLSERRRLPHVIGAHVHDASRSQQTMVGAVGVG
eukprot:COSAG06_NODE_2593_length_6607_cov_2.577904_8_plen_155_part_00